MGRAEGQKGGREVWGYGGAVRGLALRPHTPTLPHFPSAVSGRVGRVSRGGGDAGRTGRYGVPAVRQGLSAVLPEGAGQEGVTRSAISFCSCTAIGAGILSGGTAVPAGGAGAGAGAGEGGDGLSGELGARRD